MFYAHILVFFSILSFPVCSFSSILFFNLFQSFLFCFIVFWPLLLRLFSFFHTRQYIATEQCLSWSTEVPRFLVWLWLHNIQILRTCSDTWLSAPPPLEVLPSHPLSSLIRYSPPHLLLHSIPLLSTGICLGISQWKLYSISGTPYQHTIIMGNHAEQC